MVPFSASRVTEMGVSERNIPWNGVAFLLFMCQEFILLCVKITLFAHGASVLSAHIAPLLSFSKMV